MTYLNKEIMYVFHNKIMRTNIHIDRQKMRVNQINRKNVFRLYNNEFFSPHRWVLNGLSQINYCRLWC